MIFCLRSFVRHGGLRISPQGFRRMRFSRLEDGSSSNRPLSAIQSRSVALMGLFHIADERKHGPLRILSLDDPASSGNLHGTVRDLSATGFNTFDG